MTKSEPSTGHARAFGIEVWAGAAALAASLAGAIALQSLTLMAAAMHALAAGALEPMVPDVRLPRWREILLSAAIVAFALMGFYLAVTIPQRLNHGVPIDTMHITWYATPGLACAFSAGWHAWKGTRRRASMHVLVRVAAPLLVFFVAIVLPATGSRLVDTIAAAILGLAAIARALYVFGEHA